MGVYTDYLAGSHHGKGVMTAVVRSLVEASILMLNMRRIRVSVYDDNVGSRRVFEKNGFKMYATVKEAMSIPAKAGFPARKPTLYVLDWTKDVSAVLAADTAYQYCIPTA